MQDKGYDTDHGDAFHIAFGPVAQKDAAQAEQGGWNGSACDHIHR